MLVVCLFYYRLIVRWLIGPTVKVDYPLCDKSLQGTRTVVHDMSFPPSNDSEGPVERPR